MTAKLSPTVKFVPGAPPVDLAHSETLTLEHIPGMIYSLSRMQRWTGGLLTDWSVLQHSMLVARLAKDKGEPPLIVTQCLAHDLIEALTGDIPTPFKEALGLSRPIGGLEYGSRDAFKLFELDSMERVFSLLGSQGLMAEKRWQPYDQRALEIEAVCFGWEDWVEQLDFDPVTKVESGVLWSILVEDYFSQGDLFLQELLAAVQPDICAKLLKVSGEFGDRRLAQQEGLRRARNAEPLSVRARSFQGVVFA